LTIFEEHCFNWQSSFLKLVYIVRFVNIKQKLTLWQWFIL
jgi:hypothetical protein